MRAPNFFKKLLKKYCTSYNIHAIIKSVVTVRAISSVGRASDF